MLDLYLKYRTFRISPGGETGRRKGLKIPRPYGCAGSTPAPGTNPELERAS